MTQFKSAFQAQGRERVNTGVLQRTGPCRRRTFLLYDADFGPGWRGSATAHRAVPRSLPTGSTHKRGEIVKVPAALITTSVPGSWDSTRLKRR